MSKLLCLSLIVALATGSGCDSANGDLTGADMPGIVSVIVTASGTASGLPGGAAATVRLTGPGSLPEQTGTTSFGAALTFTDLPPGIYTLTTTVFAFTCQSVSATVQADQTTTVNIPCTRTAGKVAGTVTSGGSPIEGAPVEVSGPGVTRRQTTGASGTFTFSMLAGEYAVTVLHQHHTCPIQTVFVEPDQTTTADIYCTPKTTGAITGTVTHASDPGLAVLGAIVSLTGPVSRTTNSAALFGSFQFDDLPPGTYAVAASAFGFECQSASTDVLAAQTTTVQVSCTNRPPTGSEIEGEWRYNRLLRRQTGSCPQPLPETGTGSMTFSRPSDEAIRIIGLDPELAIAGDYDEESGSYTGTGAVVLSDGSTIQSVVTVTFDFDFLDGAVVFFTDATPSSVWTRQHRDPGGNPVCTEIYGASGAH